MSPQSHQGQIAGTRWDPNQYLKFSDHRLRPALELLDRVPLRFPSVIYDLGCGLGQVTGIISERWPSAAVYGLDNSQEMLAQAAATPGTVRWIEADIRTWSPDAGLRPVLNSLGDQEREIFLVEYAQHLRAAYPVRPGGRTLYPFRRLFIVATV